MYRGGSGRGEGSHYGGRSPELDPNAFSPFSRSPLDVAGGPESFTVDEFALRRAWDSSSRSTKEDWLEWMRHVSVEMLRQSPSPALRACLELASTRPRTARDLFCASFASCWSASSQNGRDALVRALESAFGAPTIPPEIVGTLLNLAEFCEHDERPLPVEARTLGAIAERCRAYAKALHYKETEFVTSPAACVEAIIAINNRLQLPEAAMGVLVYAQAHLRLEIKEGWYEKLGQWENALDAHRRKAAAAAPAARDAALEATASSAEIADARRKAGGDKELPGSLAASRGWSVGRRRGSQGGSEVTSGRDPRASTDQRSSVARKRLAARGGSRRRGAARGDARADALPRRARRVGGARASLRARVGRRRETRGERFFRFFRTGRTGVPGELLGEPSSIAEDAFVGGCGDARAHGAARHARGVAPRRLAKNGDILRVYSEFER